MGEDHAEFVSWCSKNQLSEDSVKKLEENGYASFLAVKRMNEEDIKALKLQPRGQTSLMRGAVHELLGMPNLTAETVAPSLQPQQTSSGQTGRATTTATTQSLDDVIRTVIGAGNGGSELRNQTSGTPHPLLPLSQLQAPSGEFPHAMV